MAILKIIPIKYAQRKIQCSLDTIKETFTWR
ncbi:hypothetical protein Asch02_03610 [Acinetobacter schindleri]